MSPAGLEFPVWMGQVELPAGYLDAGSESATRRRRSPLAHIALSEIELVFRWYPPQVKDKLSSK